MTVYQFALAVHLLALIAASAASGIIHFAASRRSAAGTLREAMEWGKLIAKTARVFPIVVLVLVASGSYMVAGRWSWQTGWVEVGFVGAFALLASGAIAGKRGAAEARANAERLQRFGRDLPNNRAPDRVVALLSEANTGMAIAIVLVMTLKLGLVGSLLVLVAGAALGAYRGLSQLPTHADIGDTSEFETA